MAVGSFLRPRPAYRGRHVQHRQTGWSIARLCSPRVTQQLPLVVLTVGGVLAVFLHLAAGLHYPVPWDDEAHFIAPAQNLALHSALRAPELNAPAGIFWMPDGYAVALALVFTILPDTATTGRLASLFFTLVFAGCLYAVVARLGGARLLTACALAVWLVAPLVVLMANIARMESLVLVLVGVALLAVAAGRWLSGFAIVSLTPLVHPMGILLVAAFVVAGLLVRADLTPSSRLELVLVTLAVLAWTAEAVWLATHLDLVRAHLEYQFARKLSRGLAPAAYETATVALAAAGMVGGLAARRRLGKRQAEMIVLVCVLASAFVAIQVTGNEMWYRVISRETLLLFAALAIAIARPWRLTAMRLWRLTAMRLWRLGVAQARLPARVWAGALILAIVPVTVMARATIDGSAYGMAFAAGTTDRDRAFLATVERELTTFDALQSHPQVVALDWSSGLTPYLRQHEWKNLRFVDPTPVTPLYRPPDFVLFSVSPAEPDWRRGIHERTPDASPVLHVVSPDSHAELIVYPGENARLPIY